MSLLKFENYIEQFRRDTFKEGQLSFQKEVCDILFDAEYHAKSKAVKSAIKKLKLKIAYLK